MNWIIDFYKTEDGKDPVSDFLDSLPRKHRAKALWELDLLADKGTELKEPYAKHVEDELWELRIKFASDISRVFYFIPTKTNIVLLHGFIKKTNRVPLEEIETAKKRLADYRGRCL